MAADCNRDAQSATLSGPESQKLHIIEYTFSSDGVQHILKPIEELFMTKPYEALPDRAGQHLTSSAMAMYCIYQMLLHMHIVALIMLIDFGVG